MNLHKVATYFHGPELRDGSDKGCASDIFYGLFHSNPLYKDRAPMNLDLFTCFRSVTAAKSRELYNEEHNSGRIGLYLISTLREFEPTHKSKD